MRPTIHEVNNRLEDRAVVVSLTTGRVKQKDLSQYSMEELIRLAETASVQVLGQVTQSRESPDPKWLIGKGKVEELKAIVDELEANTVIFDQELSGAQVRNLEQMLDAKIIDRTQLILDIFAQRANTREGNIQVELAQLNYLLPRLSGHGVNLSRLGGGIGTRGPGETKLETDRRHIRNRISDLKRQLEEVVRHRTLHRERRKKTGVYQIALVGYTNAGKSTLLNRLTNADVYVENQLFATLDPTSRTLELPAGKEVILTDTVGFIQNLPHELVAAFRATLEEVCEVDLILHIVDSFSEMRDEQMSVVHEVLAELGAQGKDQITVFNKIDLCSKETIGMLTASETSLRISAYSDSDLELLKSAIQNHLIGKTAQFRIPADKGELIAMLYRVGEVLESDADGDDMLMRVQLDKNDYSLKAHLLSAYEVVNGQPEKQRTT